MLASMRALSRSVAATAVRTEAPLLVAAIPSARLQPLQPHSKRLVHTTAVSHAGISNTHVDTEYNNPETPFEFNDSSMAEIKELLSKYPGNYKQSAVIPMLWIAQKQNDGWLPLAAMNRTAELCEMSPILVYEVATFYTMFNRFISHPRHHPGAGISSRERVDWPRPLTGPTSLRATGRRSGSTTFRCAPPHPAWSSAPTMCWTPSRKSWT